MTAMRIEERLTARREAGVKTLVVYITGGFGDNWLEIVRAVADAGADVIEIGIPFSDPVMDGPVIQRASEEALANGVTPRSIFASLRGADIGVPLAVMTYYNIVFRAGHDRFAQEMVDSGVSGAILPDLPLEEVGPWAEAADVQGLETIMLAAPTTPDDRLRRICDRARGFVYAVGLLGVTGEREALASSALVIAGRLKAVTQLPVLVGVGVSNPQQAAEACEVADGVIVGSAVMRRLLEGAGPSGAADFVAEIRNALDRG